MANNYQKMQLCAKKIFDTRCANLKERISSSPESAELAATSLVNKCIDEIMLDVVAEYHRGMKMGHADYFLREGDGELDSAGKDRPYEEDSEKVIKCPHCTRPINATRFARHLEVCMGLGRTSSRVASRRITSNFKESSYGGMMTDDDDDEDWSALSEKIKASKKIEPRKKKEKPRKQKPLKALKEEADPDDGLLPTTFLAMTSEERLAFISSSCGVKIDNNSKLCSRSIRCSVHTDEERTVARKQLDNICVDSYDNEEAESQSSKNETEHSCTSSPADSTSTSSSSSIKKKDKHKSKNIKVKYTPDLYMPD